jgi:hypothetical protein
MTEKKHELVYVGADDDEQGYGDGLDDVYLCTGGEWFEANGGVVEAFEHGFDAGLALGRGE